MQQEAFEALLKRFSAAAEAGDGVAHFMEKRAPQFTGH